MKNLGQMMKQAQEMQTRMQEFQKDLDSMEVGGASGAGMVTVTMNGKGAARAVSVDPSLLKAEDREVLEDLLVAAHVFLARAPSHRALRMGGGHPPAGQKCWTAQRYRSIMLLRSNSRSRPESSTPLQDTRV